MSFYYSPLFLGHKNALYQSALADQLPYSTFRFDFHGHGDSEGQPGYSHISVSSISCGFMTMTC